MLCCFRYSIRSACFSTTSSRLEPSLFYTTNSLGLVFNNNIQYRSLFLHTKKKKRKKESMTNSGVCKMETRRFCKETEFIWPVYKPFSMTRGCVRVCVCWCVGAPPLEMLMRDMGVRDKVLSLDLKSIRVTATRVLMGSHNRVECELNWMKISHLSMHSFIFVCLPKSMVGMEFNPHDGHGEPGV